MDFISCSIDQPSTERKRPFFIILVGFQCQWMRESNFGAVKLSAACCRTKIKKERMEHCYNANITANGLLNDCKFESIFCCGIALQPATVGNAYHISQYTFALSSFALKLCKCKLLDN